MNIRRLPNHLWPIGSALLINVLLFMGIAFLCQDEAPDLAMTVANPIHLASAAAPLAAQSDDQPLDPMQPRMPQKAAEIPQPPQEVEPQPPIEPTAELETPDFEYDIDPNLLSSMKVPQPVPQPKPKAVPQRRRVERPPVASSTPAAPPGATAGSGGGDPHGTDGGSSGGGGGGSGSGMFGSGEFGTDEVDQAPQIVKQEKPAYPLLARRRNLTGKVTVKFLVDRFGKVCKPQIVDAHPRGVFEQSVLDSVTRWHFKPGIYRGKEVATWVVLPVQFRLTES